MDYEMSALLLEGKVLEHYDCEIVSHNGADCRAITNLSKINVFIGANNSGKSRFMRNLAATAVYSYRPTRAQKEIKELKMESYNTFDKMISSLTEFGFSQIAIEKICDIFTDNEFVGEGQSITAELDDFYSRIQSTVPMKYVKGSQWHEGKVLNERCLQEFSSHIDDFNLLTEGVKNHSRLKFKKLYIPTLRGLRSIEGQNDLYLRRTQADYFGDGVCPEIFTGLGFYKELTELLLGDLDARQIVVEFQNFLSVNFFSGQDVALIPRLGGDVIYVKIGNELEYPIYSLGDGIQSIICITFPLFARKKEHLVAFIEEPEIYMHPGLQRVLLNTLLNRFENHQYFITTHSNHFLDLTLEYSSIAVFTFQKELQDNGSNAAMASFAISNVNNDALNTLELLGVKNSSVFLSNCTIWVEGITDRKYLQHCLDLYHKSQGLDLKYKLDTHYSFVEYSGGNIVHWSFLDKCSGINVDRLCGKLLLVSDRDKIGSYKEERHNALRDNLKERYCVLSCREMENTLTPNVITSLIKQFENDDSLSLPKFEQIDYKNELLGHYIEKVLLKGSKKRKGKYADTSGTITQKYRFWEMAIAEITSFNDLSAEIKALVKKMSGFIVKNNPV